MKTIGYESWTSWIIAIGSCIINCTSQTPYRIAGLMYVSIVEYYGTDRETASIPILIFIFVRCLSGPFCGVLAQKFSAENITLYGSLLAAFGFGGCFFAENITGLSLCLGIIFGLGMTGSNTLLPSITKKYFNKNLNTANGIGQAGSCVGAVLIPPIAVYLLNVYGLPGTFLIISALMLHAVPVSMIMKYAGFVQDKIIAATKRNKQFANQEHINSSKQNGQATHVCLDDTLPEKTKLKNEHSLFNSVTKISTSNEKGLADLDTKNQLFLSNAQTEICVNNQIWLQDSNSKLSNVTEALKSENAGGFTKSEENESIFKNFLVINDKRIKANDVVVNEENTALLQENNQSNDYEKTANILDPGEEIIDKPKNCNNDFNITSNINSMELPIRSSIKNQPELHESKISKKSKLRFLKVFLNPSFLVIMLCTGLHNYVSVLVWTTMIDYSRDKGISRSDEVFFLMVHPLCEIVGRVGFGWVTDLRYLSITKFSMVCFTLMALTCGCVLWSVGFWTMMLGAVTFCVATGAMTAVFPGMVFASVPEDLQTMAIASRYVLSGILIFTSAPLIGYFRENQGSYDGIYYLLISICIVCVAIMPLSTKFSPHA